jgi:hypothetical protein
MHVNRSNHNHCQTGMEGKQTETGTGTSAKGAAISATAALGAALAAMFALVRSATAEESEDELNPSFLDELRGLLGQERVLIELDEREARGKPWNSYHAIVELPSVVALPESTEEVAEIVKLCNKYKVPITPYGGGTSLVRGNTHRVGRSNRTKTLTFDCNAGRATTLT